MTPPATFAFGSPAQRDWIDRAVERYNLRPEAARAALTQAAEAAAAIHGDPRVLEADEFELLRREAHRAEARPFNAFTPYRGLLEAVRGGTPPKEYPEIVQVAIHFGYGVQ